jgi:hypothetical protein
LGVRFRLLVRCACRKSGHEKEHGGVGLSVWVLQKIAAFDCTQTPLFAFPEPNVLRGMSASSRLGILKYLHSMAMWSPSVALGKNCQRAGLRVCVSLASKLIAETRMICPHQEGYLRRFMFSVFSDFPRFYRNEDEDVTVCAFPRDIQGLCMASLSEPARIRNGQVDDNMDVRWWLQKSSHQSTHEGV